MSATPWTDREKVEYEGKNALDKAELEKKRDAEEAKRDAERALKKLQREHELALDSAEDAAVTSLQEDEQKDDAELRKLLHQNLMEVANGALERSRDSAKYVQTAGTAIFAIYTGVLGIVFSVTEYPLPLRGIAAAVFLGLAIALATAYLAYLTTAEPPAIYEGGGSLEETQLNRTAYFIRWVTASVGARRWAIRGSVVSIALGVAFIPAPFVSSHRAAAVPAAPTAPEIPATVASQIAPQAEKLFAAQVADYEAAATARNSAVEAAAEARKKSLKDEKKANKITLWLGIAGLLLVGFVIVISWPYRTRRPRSTNRPPPPPVALSLRRQ